MSQAVVPLEDLTCLPTPAPVSDQTTATQSVAPSSSPSLALVPVAESRNALFHRPPPRRRSPTRNALTARPRRRNAAPPPARADKIGKAAAPKGDGETNKTGVQRFGDSLWSVLASGVTSVGGAIAARNGVHPYLVTSLLAGVGFAGGWISTNERRRQIFSGIASTGVSQIALMAIAKSNDAKNTNVAKRDPQPAPPNPPPRLKNADLSAMPPGVLDAAFERARASHAIEDEHNAGFHPHMTSMPFVA